MVPWMLSMARSTRASASPGSSVISSRDVLQREADRVQRLDDAVVEVLADALALLEHREVLQLLVQAGVVDRDAGMSGERLHEPLVVRR